MRLIPQERHSAAHRGADSRCPPYLQVVKEMVKVDQIIHQSVSSTETFDMPVTHTKPSTNNQDGSEDSGGSSTGTVLD